MKSFIEYINESDIGFAERPHAGPGKSIGGLKKNEAEMAMEREKAIALHRVAGKEIPDFVDPQQGDLDDESTPNELRGGHARSDYQAQNSADQIEHELNIQQIKKQSEGLQEGGKKWIQKADIKKGALHRELGIPEDEKIPVGKLTSIRDRLSKEAEGDKTLDAKKSRTLKRVNLALSFRKMDD